MFWAHAVHVDLPVDAGSAEAHRAASALTVLLDVVDRSVVGQLSLAISGAATVAFARHGEGRVLDRIAALRDQMRLDLLATAMHGALLPLLPPEEIHRQLDLSDAENERVFGDLYRPLLLWSPQLAYSRKVAEVAAKRGLIGMIVDELAMRRGAAPWPGRTVPALEGLPGFFLLPRSRVVSDAMQADGIHAREDLLRLAPGLRWEQERYLLTTEESGRELRTHDELAKTFHVDISVRASALIEHFPLGGTVSPLPCSARTRAEELHRGIPFSAWFSPDSPLQDAQWRFYLGTLETLRELERQGLQAMPGVRRLRGELDVMARESWWRAASPEDWAPATVLDGMERLRHRIADVLPLIDPERAEDLDDLASQIASATARSAREVAEVTAPYEEAPHAPM